MSSLPRTATTSAPIHPVLAGRWSPRGFDPLQVLTREALVPLLEAARWSPSAGNTQPWRFVVALRGEPLHARLMAALNPGNQLWAGRAAAMIVAVALHGDDTGRAYPLARYDTGQAVAHLSVQAAAEGLSVHQMAGFRPAQVSVAAGLQDGQEPVVVLVVGRTGGEDLPVELAARERGARSRRPLAELLLPG